MNPREIGPRPDVNIETRNNHAELADELDALLPRHRSELLAAEAAALRLAAELVHKHFDPNGQCVPSILERNIFSLIRPDAQSALDAHDAEVRRMAKLEEMEKWRVKICSYDGLPWGLAKWIGEQFNELRANQPTPGADASAFDRAETK